MIKLGLTGGIGSGKTLICKILEHLGAEVYNADLEARKILENDKEILKKIESSFGDQVLTNGLPDRKKLAHLVFNDPQKLKILNEIIHPAVIAGFEKFCDKNKNSKFIILESAILFETGLEQMFDYSVLVFAPENVRIQRVMKRDHVSEEEVVARIKNQSDDRLKLSKADFLIINDDQNSVIEQVVRLLNDLGV